MDSRWFKDRLTRKRYAEGNWNTPESAEELVFKGYIQLVSGAGSVKNGAVSADSTHRIYCPSDTDIILNDEITDAAGNVYVVTLATPGGVAGLGKHSEIEVTRR